MIRAYLYGGALAIVGLFAFYVYYLQTSLNELKITNASLTEQIQFNKEATIRLKEAIRNNQEKTIKIQKTLASSETKKNNRNKEIASLDLDKIVDSTEVEEKVNNEINQAFANFATIGN